MTSARTQVSYIAPNASYLSPALSLANPPPRKNKLRREERDRGGNVLPSGSGTGYGQTNGYGVTSNGLDSGRLAPRIRDTLADAKERRRTKRTGQTVTKGNMLLDDAGNAHDSECEQLDGVGVLTSAFLLTPRFRLADVQFRTATPVHIDKQRARSEARNGADDASVSSSSSSSSGGSDVSAFQSSPYTYQSTHRTASSTHHHYSGGMGATASAIPGYLAPRPVRTSYDHGLTVPRAPSPRRSSAEYSQRPTSILSGVNGGGSRAGPSSIHRSVYTNGNGDGRTTASYQPPAPTFNPRPMDFTNGPLRLPPQPAPSSLHRTTRPGVGSSIDARSLTESMAQTSLAETTGGSGYNTYLAPKTDGTLMDAGVHGMKRSWDGFKLEMKFGECCTAWCGIEFVCRGLTY